MVLVFGFDALPTRSQFCLIAMALVSSRSVRPGFCLFVGWLFLCGVISAAAAVQSLASDQLKVVVVPVLVPATGGGQPFEFSDASPGEHNPAATGNEWVIAPIPFVNPLLGAGLTGGVAYIYHPPDTDKSLPPWTTGVGLFYSENKSWGVALGHKMNLRRDGARLSGLAGYGVVNYDFYGIGEDAAGNARLVSLEQTVLGLTTEGLFRLKDHLYAGLNYSLSNVKTRYTGNSLPPWLNDIVSKGQLDSLLSLPALRMQWDSRNDSFLPTEGWLMDGELTFSDESFGSDFNYQALTLSAKHYWSLSDRQTMAVFGYGRFASGDVPFFALSMIGAKGNLRGYPVGRYQDLMVLTGQVEYRWQAWRRVGLVAFGGVGATAPDLGGFTDTTTLPSFGVGVRYLLTEENKLNFRLDVAWGRDDRLIYVGVGEAF